MKDIQVAFPIHFLHLINAKLASSWLVFFLWLEKVEPSIKPLTFAFAFFEIPNFDFFHLRKNSKAGLKCYKFAKLNEA